MTFATVAAAGSTQLALPLHSSWTFWYLIRHGRGAVAAANYESNLHSIGTFSTAEDFWAVYGHLKRPRELAINSDYQVFRAGIKPAWEDDANALGGKWALLAACSGLLDDYGVCGMIVSVRYAEDIISVWNRNANDEDQKIRLRDQLRLVLQLPSSVHLEYKAHDTAYGRTEKR
ncbi:putative eukaryotic initiation factor 4E, partial [Paramicrosporidium saccamoebae]